LELIIMGLIYGGKTAVQKTIGQSQSGEGREE